jgi:aryl-alcohol dehydrogenase-like predicted oxidoreductase
MQSLNAVVNAGKVLYLGASDTPAWVVAKANQYARDHGLRQFSVYQGKWSAANRDFERDIIPMAVSEGMSLAPWGALGSGQFKSESQRATGEGRKSADAPSEAVIKVTDVLEKIAKAKDTAITSVALAYVMHKTPYVFPIVGGRKIEHLKGNIEALGLVLSEEDMKEIEGATPFDIGFPVTMLGKDAASSWLNAIGGHFQYVEEPKAIAPHKG